MPLRRHCSSDGSLALNASRALYCIVNKGQKTRLWMLGYLGVYSNVISSSLVKGCFIIHIFSGFGGVYQVYPEIAVCKIRVGLQKTSSVLVASSWAFKVEKVKIHFSRRLHVFLASVKCSRRNHKVLVQHINHSCLVV